MKHTRTDIRVRRVLSTLTRNQSTPSKEFAGSKSLREVTLTYNKYYPPGIFGKIVGLHVSEVEIKSMLDFLVTEGLVARELLSFTDQYLKAPELYYHLSRAGTEYTRRKK
jgi:hypothetical protein